MYTFQNETTHLPESIDTLVRAAYAHEGFIPDRVRINPFRNGAQVVYVEEGSNKGDGLYATRSAHFCMYDLDFTSRMSYNGGLMIERPLRGKGRGAAFVRVRENVCQQLGIHTVLINICTNKDFWRHQGYTQVGLQKFYGEWRKQSKALEPLGIRLRWSAHFKRLSTTI